MTAAPRRAGGLHDDAGVDASPPVSPPLPAVEGWELAAACPPGEATPGPGALYDAFGLPGGDTLALVGAVTPERASVALCAVVVRPGDGTVRVAVATHRRPWLLGYGPPRQLSVPDNPPVGEVRPGPLAAMVTVVERGETLVVVGGPPTPSDGATSERMAAIPPGLTLDDVVARVAAGEGAVALGLRRV